MSGPIVFPAPQMPNAVRQALDLKADQSFVADHFAPKKTINWHEYFNETDEYDYSPQWIKLASWVHARKNTTFSAQFNLVNRNTNAALNVHIRWDGIRFVKNETSLGFVGSATIGFKARLIKVSEYTLNGFIAAEVELWVRHNEYSQKGHVSVERLGGHRIEYLQSIKLDYKNVRTLSTKGNEIEPTGEVVLEVDHKSGINDILAITLTPLVLLNGFASHSSPLSFKASSAGLVEIIGVIDIVNIDGSQAVTTIDTIFSRMPFGYEPKQDVIIPMAMGPVDTVMVKVGRDRTLQFTAPLTSNVYIHIQYQL